MFNAGIITVSDRCSRKERTDESGQVIRFILEKNEYKVSDYAIVPDEEKDILDKILFMSDELNLDLIITTGGTGFSVRDVTPEATKKAITKEVFGISEAIRQYSMSITKRAMLSRAISGIRNRTLIVNLPGSPKAVSESLEYIIDTLAHGLKVLKGNVSDCAR
jgi:molybdenum cofactor synthesis domain-containing protein